MHLMGKFKLNDWIELDHLDNNNSPDIEEEKLFLMDMYKEDKGNSWLFKWVE